MTTSIKSRCLDINYMKFEFVVLKINIGFLRIVLHRVLPYLLYSKITKNKYIRMHTYAHVYINNKNNNSGSRCIFSAPKLKTSAIRV